MSATTLQVKLVAKRMLTKAEAAQHCGRSLRQFGLECPVRPVRFDNGDIRYDVRDLDSWLDTLKSSEENDANAILGRLE
jgi:hypothetical protein